MWFIKELLKLIASEGGKYLLSMIIFFVGVTFEALDRAIVGDQLMALAVVFLLAHAPKSPPPSSKPVRARTPSTAKSAKSGAKPTIAARTSVAKVQRQPKLARPSGNLSE